MQKKQCETRCHDCATITHRAYLDGGVAELIERNHFSTDS